VAVQESKQRGSGKGITTLRLCAGSTIEPGFWQGLAAALQWDQPGAGKQRTDKVLARAGPAELTLSWVGLGSRRGHRYGRPAATPHELPFESRPLQHTSLQGLPGFVAAVRAPLNLQCSLRVQGKEACAAAKAVKRRLCALAKQRAPGQELSWEQGYFMECDCGYHECDYYGRELGDLSDQE